ncbi:MAG: FAD-binding oxidoreductase [Planctomycetes bacterium]|nr:FAD-binding oxidoreductase [Planctomycetota bacterium]
MKRFLLDVEASGFEGAIATDECARTIASTDNSIWQVLPQVVIAPKSQTGVAQVVKILSDKAHKSISITPRGGGTSTAGQTLTNSIVLDCKRYMHRILKYDTASKRVTVECGAVLEQVNDALKQHGVMLGPTVATASRATIGGMIGNDSAGKGSQVYGKMSDCVVSLNTVIRGGTTFNNDLHLIDAIKQACNAARPHFHSNWPNLSRFVSGYNLPMAWDGESFDSNRIFCGSEGTLGVTTSATLQCVAIPKNQQLLLLCFDSFDRALRCGVDLAKLRPTAIETVDEMVLQTLRTDTSWHSVSQLLSDARDDVNAILFVESNDVSNLLDVAKAHNPILSSVLLDPESQNIAWSFRSRSVGLLSSLSGDKRPVPFVEDCAVPPENLADFVLAFKNLLAQHDIRAGMFGHVDAGVIHIRPALNMCRESDRDKIRPITEEVVALVHSFGGVLWGEHGKGFRSALGPRIFGDAIWEQLCNVKRAFDPYNQFNPGKVAVPDTTYSIASITTPTRGERDEHSAAIPILSNAKACDGNSECQSVSLSNKMCPTYRATDDPAQSPRGRADVLRHWLNRLDPSKAPKKFSLFRRLLHSGNSDDFNHDVKAVLDGCNACKACSSGCPVQIDIPKLRSEFYNLYFARYLRPLSDLVWLYMERSIPFQNILPSRFIASMLGVCDAPKPTYELKKLVNISTPQQIVNEKPDVVLLQDTFTTYYRPAPFLAMLKILHHLGKRVAVLPVRQNGKALHVRGSLKAFNKVANDNIAWLTPIQRASVPIVCIDPAATLLWRDEYPTNSIEVLLPQEWLLKQDVSTVTLEGSWRLFPHCVENATESKSSNQWKMFFELIGGNLNVIETACCGMGGLFGHQKEHKQISLDIWDLHWAPHKPVHSDSLATGYSCYAQSKRIENIHLRHPLEVIASTIR